MLSGMKARLDALTYPCMKIWTMWVWYWEGARKGTGDNLRKEALCAAYIEPSLDKSQYAPAPACGERTYPIRGRCELSQMCVNV